MFVLWGGGGVGGLHEQSCAKGNYFVRLASSVAMELFNVAQIFYTSTHSKIHVTYKIHF